MCSDCFVLICKCSVRTVVSFTPSLSSISSSLHLMTELLCLVAYVLYAFGAHGAVNVFVLIWFGLVGLFFGGFFFWRGGVCKSNTSNCA